MTILRAATVSGVAAALSLATVPGADATATRAVGVPMRGMDISAFQHARAPIDWVLLVRRGVRFVAVKVSEGTYYRNPYYQSDARAAAAAGLPVMPYVFANPGRGDGAATANFAVKATGTGGSGLLPLVVDLENDPYTNAADCYGLGIPAMTAWIARFTARAEALTGKWPVIYTTAAWWKECAGSTGQFRRDPLWLASFGETPPTVPSPWLHWTFWQYTNGGSLPGVGQTDLDYYQPTSDLPALHPPAQPRSGKERPPKPKPKTPKPRPAKPRPAKPRPAKPRAGKPKPRPGKRKPAKPRPGKPRAAKPRAAKPKPKPGKPRAAKSRAGKSRAGKPRAAKSRAGKPRAAKPRPGKPKPAKPKPVKSKPAKSRPGKPRPAKPRPGKPRAAKPKPKPGKPRAAKSRAAKPRPAKPKATKPRTWSRRAKSKHQPSR